MASNAQQLGLGALAAAAVGVIVIVLFPPSEGPIESDPAELSLDAAAPLETVPMTTDEAPSTDTASTDETVDVVQDDVAAAPVSQPVVPTIDGFRMAADGVGTLVGSAAPGATVDVILAGAAITRLQADGAGSFATTLLLEPSPDPRRLALMADPDGAQIMSEGQFFVQPTVAIAGVEDADDDEAPIVVGAVTAVEPEPSVAEIADESAKSAQDGAAADGSIENEAVAGATASTDMDAPRVTVEVAEPQVDVAGETDVVAEAVTQSEPTGEEPAELVAVDDENRTEPADDPAEVADAEANDGNQPSQNAATEQPQTPTVIVADSDGVRVVQNAQGPEVMSAIALDAITYDPEGEVKLSGRAIGEGFVRVYVDNRPVTTSRISAGAWTTALPEVDTGVYTLRIDEVDDSGAVVSRIETPFKREEPEAVAAVMAEETAKDGFDVAVRTVQPGATLWAIAREEMGEGIMYVAVYEANRDLIKDPDLIYPGQVFRIPKFDE